MALLELAAATAGAGIISIDVRESPLQDRHHLFRFVAAPDQAGHEFHRKIDVMKEQLEAGAEVIQARLAIRCFDEPIFRTFAVAGKAHIAFAA